jgi:alkaline phosphatase
MKRFWERFIASFLVLALLVSAVVFLNTGNRAQASNGSNVTIDKIVKERGTKAPKYIFLFIGDGMSYPQVQATSYYLGATKTNGQVVAEDLSFMNFPIAGSAQTFDSTSFCPDSASTATSISTGFKTYSGVINMDTSMTIKYETISEKLKKQLGYKIGVITSVNLNHATPAAFYAHQASRNNYYEIGLEMIASGFDYFAGGALINPDGNKKDQRNLYDIAQENGYRVVKAQTEAQALTRQDGKAIIVSEVLADSSAMSYEIDAAANEWKLADYVRKGIEVLDNDKGFFMMVEGGKIDWACHANDAGSTIQDTVALSNAVNVAIDFYNKYPEETLILVTGDHETGGLTIGFAGTDYNTYMKNISNQKISYAKFDAEYVSGYKKNGAKFSQVLSDIEKNFGLVPENRASSAADSHLVLTDYEYNRLLEAYNMTMNEIKQLTEAQYVLYGTYEPLTVTICHILNNKSGIDFTSYAHTGLPVPVFALGNGAELFEGYYDNTDIYDNLAVLTSVR